jgi:hypothetical protein
VFSNLFSITLPNIGKYFPGIHFPEIHFPKKNYFPAKKRVLMMVVDAWTKKSLLLYLVSLGLNLVTSEGQGGLSGP